MVAPGNGGPQPYVCGVEVEKEGVAIIWFLVDDGGGDGEGSFKVKYMGRMQRRSHICLKQERGRLEMWLDKER